MLFAGDGYCRYERDRTRVECDCAHPQKNGAAAGATASGRRGQQLVDGRRVRCEDCDGKMCFWVNRVTYQCPGDVVGGKVRKHRDIHKRLWADESESMANSKS